MGKEKNNTKPLQAVDANKEVETVEDWEQAANRILTDHLGKPKFDEIYSFGLGVQWHKNQSPSVESIVGFVLEYLNTHDTEIDVELGMFHERKADIIKELKK